jgi:hypothetical protein
MLQELTTPATPLEKASRPLVEWDELRSSGALLSVYRTKVPGGWLVYACNGYHHHGGLTFYPDPTHSWANGSQG